MPWKIVSTTFHCIAVPKLREVGPTRGEGPNKDTYSVTQDLRVLRLCSMYLTTF